MNKFDIFVLLLLASSLSFVSAYEFDVSASGEPLGVPYSDEEVALKGTITPSVSGGCELICKWSVGSGDNSINGGAGIGNDVKFPFDYSVVASGSGGVRNFVLDVECMRSPEGVFCVGSEYESERENLGFSFEYCGDREVTSNHETCSSCSEDVGKCDGGTCSKGVDCEGENCVHGVCWNKPYREGDNYCDAGETCSNSQDCACGDGYNCVGGRCETDMSEIDTRISEVSDEVSMIGKVVSKVDNVGKLSTVKIVLSIIVSVAAIIFYFSKFSSWHKKRKGR